VDAARERWNEFYMQRGADFAWGVPSPLYEWLCDMLPSGARILDLGCGDGRNAVLFARRDFETVAVDISDVAIGRLERNAGVLVSRIACRREDIACLPPLGRFDLVICHGVLNSLPPESWHRVLSSVKAHTRTGAMCAVVVFSRTDSHGLTHPYVSADFPLSILDEQFDGWESVLRDSYVREHDHDGIGSHVHIVERLVVRRPRHDAPLLRAMDSAGSQAT
jgi:tellurite methyltransferase